ncbi:MAG: sulfatase [Planctomycetes bacterium]|nr:sulfatase [Planctomycetota bacterium]
MVVCHAAAQDAPSQTSRPYNVLFIIADDLATTALSCYGSKVSQTPNIDALARRGTLFQRAYCQGSFCGPSRASMLSGYYPHAIRMLGYRSPRQAIGDRATLPQHFKNAGYDTVRVSKVFHMGVPGDIETGANGADDEASWTERFNSPGPEWRAPGQGETLESNPQGEKPVMGGNTFVTLAAAGDDLVHSDGRTAAKACELIAQHRDRPFFLAVGFVRPHVPFVAPAAYFEAFPPEAMRLPEKRRGDQGDIPKAGINYKTSQNMQMDLVRQRKAMAGYFAAVAYMDAQVGKVIQALDEQDLTKNTVIVFTSDHGFHLGEHDFWAKVSLHEESVRVPLILCVPGKKPAVSRATVELLDLFPTLARLCRLDVPARLQGLDISPLLNDPKGTVRDTAFCVNGKGFLLRSERWAYLQYGEDASGGVELYDMQRDPQQYTNLAASSEHAATVATFRVQLADKLRALRSNDLKAP